MSNASWYAFCESSTTAANANQPLFRLHLPRPHFCAVTIGVINRCCQDGKRKKMEGGKMNKSWINGGNTRASFIDFPCIHPTKTMCAVSLGNIIGLEWTRAINCDLQHLRLKSSHARVKSVYASTTKTNIFLAQRAIYTRRCITLTSSRFLALFIYLRKKKSSRTKRFNYNYSKAAMYEIFNKFGNNRCEW